MAGRREAMRPLFLMLACTVVLLLVASLANRGETIYSGGLLVERVLKDLTEKSALIVEGNIAEVSPAFHIRNNVTGSVANFTDYTMRIDATLRGQAEEDTITIRTEGGTVGKYTEINDCSPELNVGSSYLVFLYRPCRGGWYHTEGDHYYVLGKFQGAFTQTAEDTYTARDVTITRAEL